MEQQKLPPGFRFSPTDEELVIHYLKNRACGKDYQQGVVAEVDIYKHEPWDLPEKAALFSPDPVWYFFNAQDRRHSHSARINRTTSKGYWKATGKDKKICSGPHTVGIRKTLIYYEGRAPSGKRTDWIMHEYKLDEDYEKRSKVVCVSSALCRIRRKGGPGPRNGEQYGAPVYNENGEWGEDVDDDVDEKVPLASPHTSNVAASLAIKEEVLHDRQAEGLALNDLTHAGIVDTNAELDIYTFLDAFLTDNPEVTNLEDDSVSSNPAMDGSQMGQDNFNCNTGCLYAPSDVERLLGLDGTNVHDILHPTCNEEQILGELLHLTDGSQCLSNFIGSSCEGPVVTEGILYPEVADSNAAFGNFIEMNDMNSPLDGFVLRSPSYYGIEQQELPPDVFDEVESFACSFDMLNSQGLATRRVRLQIPPQQSGLMHKSESAVPGSNGVTIEIESISDNDGQKLANGSSGSDSGDIIRRFPPKGHADEESFAPKTTNYINKIKVQPVVANAVSFAPSLLSTTSCMKEATLDCESGGAANANAHIREAGLDCEAGPSSTVSSGKSFKLAHASFGDQNNEIGQLTSKVKGLSLGSRLSELESNLSTTFNDKVFALGKPVARLFPSKDYVNPYRTLRSGAMASLCHLGLAILVLLFLFLVIHMLSKYVLSLAA